MNPSTSNKLLIPAVIVIVALILVGGVYWINYSKSVNQPAIVVQNVATTPAPVSSAQNPVNASSTPMNDLVASSTVISTAGSKTYTDSTNGFSLQYPRVLNVSAVNGTLTTSHSISDKHPDFCNMKDYTMLDTLTDFKLTGTVKSGSPADVIRANNYYGVKFDSSGKPIIAQGGILNSYMAGNLSGYVASTGVEGCGTDVYFLPLSGNKTLVLTNYWVGEFSSVNADAAQNEKIPGIIVPEQNRAYVHQILASINTVPVSDVQPTITN